MCVDKYAYDMSDERFAFVYTLIELVKRGFGRKEAKKMIKTSTLMERLKLKLLKLFRIQQLRCGF